MTILSLKTDSPEAETGLYDDNQHIGHINWQAHRQLAETLHARIALLLSRFNKNLEDLEGVVVFAGPGSFTGLRIGVSVANALAYSLGVPIAGSTGKDWIQTGFEQLKLTPATNTLSVLPEYGSPVHTTLPRK